MVDLYVEITGNEQIKILIWFQTYLSSNIKKTLIDLWDIRFQSKLALKDCWLSYWL